MCSSTNANTRPNKRANRQVQCNEREFDEGTNVAAKRTAAKVVAAVAVAVVIGVTVARQSNCTNKAAADAPAIPTVENTFAHSNTHNSLLHNTLR